MSIEYFDRNGKRMSMMAWAKTYEDTSYRVLGSHHVGNLWVSTVWLGLDHRWFESGPPLIFESAIFAIPAGDDRWEILEMRRLSTEHEAMISHAEFIQIADVMTEIDKGVSNEP